MMPFFKVLKNSPQLHLGLNENEQYILSDRTREDVIGSIRDGDRLTFVSFLKMQMLPIYLLIDFKLI